MLVAPSFKFLLRIVMISENLVFVQLAQADDYIGIVELAIALEASVSEVRQRLKDLGDRVEHNERDEWRVVRNIVSSSLLSETEKEERDNLERTVEQAFYIAGKALKLLRDKRLYRENHATFEAYVKERFDFTKRAAYYLIDAAEVVNNLKTAHSHTGSGSSEVSSDVCTDRPDGEAESLPKSEQFVHSNKFTSVLPTKESQCRPLAKLPPQRQREAWCKAVELAGGKKVPSARLVKKAIKEIDSIDNPTETNKNKEIQPRFQEVNYQAGMGLEYRVKLDETTYNRLQSYQDKIGTASKNGAIARLLDEVDE